MHPQANIPGFGDDDLIFEGTLAYVLKTLKEKSDLSLLYLNFSGRDK